MLTAAASARGRSRCVFLRAATALSAVSPQKTVNDGRGAADTGLNADGPCRAIAAARSAFHTGVALDNLSVFAVHSQDIVRADIQAHPAARTFLPVQLKRCHIFKIKKIAHFFSLEKFVLNLEQGVETPCSNRFKGPLT